MWFFTELYFQLIRFISKKNGFEPVWFGLKKNWLKTGLMRF